MSMLELSDGVDDEDRLRVITWWLPLVVFGGTVIRS